MTEELQSSASVSHFAELGLNTLLITTDNNNHQLHFEQQQISLTDLCVSHAYEHTCRSPSLTSDHGSPCRWPAVRVRETLPP